MRVCNTVYSAKMNNTMSFYRNHIFLYMPNCAFILIAYARKYPLNSRLNRDSFVIPSLMSSTTVHCCCHLYYSSARSIQGLVYIDSIRYICYEKPLIPVLSILPKKSADKVYRELSRARSLVFFLPTNRACLRAYTKTHARFFAHA